MGIKIDNINFNTGTLWASGKDLTRSTLANRLTKVHGKVLPKLIYNESSYALTALIAYALQVKAQKALISYSTYSSERSGETFKYNVQNYVETTTRQYERETNKELIYNIRAKDANILERTEDYNILREKNWVTNSVLNRLVRKITNNNIYGYAEREINGHKQILIVTAYSIMSDDMTSIVAATLIYKAMLKNEDNPEIDELFQSLSKAMLKTKEFNEKTIIPMIENFINNTTIYDIDVDKILKEHLKRYFDSKEKYVRDNYERKTKELTVEREKIKDLLDSLEELSEELRRICIKKETTELATEKVINILKTYPVITKYDMLDSGTLSIHIRQPLSTNSEEDLEEVLTQGYIEYNSKDSEKLAAELLIRALCKHEFEIITESVLWINTVENRFGAARGTVDINNALPHPHLCGYACFGTYETILKEYLAKRDIENTIDTMINASSEINWADHPVVEKALFYIQDLDTEKMFINKNGIAFSFYDVIRKGIKECEALE